MEKNEHKVILSILDLAVVTQGGSAAITYKNSVELAKLAERLGYERYWISEHHNMEGVASTATAILITNIAKETSKIRVGAGGVMLPNYAPLFVAEQYGALATLFPDRIDLGIGRAPGTDPLAARFLRRDLNAAGKGYLDNILELQNYFSEENKHSAVRALPGEGLDVPIIILGSSTESAYVAARLGLPYSFANHFAPAQFEEAIGIYRENFKPSAQLKKPYIIVGTNVIAADTDKEAQFIATSMIQMFLGIIKGTSGRLPAPVEDMDEIWSVPERSAVSKMTNHSFIGDKEKIKSDLMRFKEQHQVDEFIITSHIYSHKARMRSYEILSEAMS